MAAPGKSGIYIDMDGEPVDLAEIGWIQVAPCGCVSAIHVAYSDFGGKARICITTPEQAAIESSPSKAEREQDIERGFYWKPARRGDWPKETCAHDPQWGYVHRPEPDGLKWAIGGWYGGLTRTLHLVPEAVVRTDDFDPPYRESTATTLCGTTKYPWSERWHETSGKVECKRCWAKGEALVTA